MAKFQETSFLTTFNDFKKIEIFLKKFCLSHFLSHNVIFHKFTQKLGKNCRVHSQKKMLLRNGLTENIKFIGPFPSEVQLKMTLHQLLGFAYFFLESDSYF